MPDHPVPVPQPVPRDPVLSTQVSGSRYFFLGLSDTSRAGVIPAYGGFERCDPDYVVQREGFHFHALELVVAGEGTVRLNRRRHELHAGSLYHYDRRVRLDLRANPAKPMSKYFLCITGARASARLRAAGLRSGGFVQLAMFTEVQRLWDDIIREGGHHRPTSGRLLGALVEVLLLKIEELAGLPVSPGQTAEEAFVRCKGIIEAQSASLHTLGEVTRATGIGATRLSRLFRHYQGLSPYQYLLRRKMSLAAELLMNPATLVKEAAAQVGFTDPYHFSRCFKQVHRVAPKTFQRSLKHI